MNDKTKDPLARWWWPGQWLYIVYGIWIDQLWYWQNVRPRLRGRLGGPLYIQGMLGATLVVTFATLAIVVLSSIAGAEIHWNTLVMSVTLGLIGSIVLGMMRVIDQGLSASLIYGVTLSIVVSTLLVIFSGSLDDTVLKLQSSAVSVIWGVFWGIAFSIARYLIKGVPSGVNVDIFLVAAICTTAAMQSGVMTGIVTAIGFGAGYYLGGKWAIRQVPDKEARRRLANPDN